ncbi:MAG: BPSS1780 family membrane protein [Ramlibacter sp.]
MKLNIVPPRTGVLWVKLGIRAVLRQPLAMVGLFLMDWFVLFVLAAMPVFGLVASLVLVPAGALGYMVATSDVAAGNLPLPTRLLAGFRQGRERSRALVKLGVMHAAIVLVILLVTSWLFPLPDPLPKDDPLAVALSAGHLVAFAIQLPVTMLFCYAPALSHWHGVPATKALFFSVVAMWKNLGAFTVCALAWLAVCALLSTLLAAAYAVLGTSFVVALALPVSLALSAMMLASTYFTFRDSFSADTVDDGGPPPAA